MKMLTGYLAPSKGTASIGGHCVQGDRIKASELIGYLPENGPLYAEMTPNSLLTYLGKARGLDKDALGTGSNTFANTVRCSRSGASRLGNSPKGIDSESEWGRLCCTIRRC